MTTEHETKIQRYEPAPKSLDRLRAQRAIRPATLDMQESTSLLSYWRVLLLYHETSNGMFNRSGDG